MDDVHRDAIKNVKDEKQGCSVKEKELMRQKGILGKSTVKALMYTNYFYNGKSFLQRSQDLKI